MIESQQGRAGFLRTADNWEGNGVPDPDMDEQSLALTALGGTRKFKPIVDFLSDITVYSIFPDALRGPQRFDAHRRLNEHGENWVSILKELIKKSESKDDLISGLRKLTGDIEDIRVKSAAGYLISEFKQQVRSDKGKRWFSAALQSDGTLRVAGLLTALLQEPGLPVIGIEEPELTVHPGTLPMLYDYLKQASERSQVIITTHSPIILDVIDIEQDKVLLVDRQDGKTRVEAMKDAQLEPVRKRLLSLGDLFTSGDTTSG